MRPLPLALPLLLAGCTCNQDYGFPKRVDVVVDPPESFGSWLSMDTAPDGVRLTITYYDRVEGALGFATGTPNDDGTVTWAHEHVDGYKGEDGLDRGDMGKYSSHRVAPDGTVWVAYQDAKNGGLYAAHRQGPNQWETMTVDAGPGMGHWASLDLDAAGNPVVAHHDAAAGTLRVSRWLGEAWSSEVVATGTDMTFTGDTGLQQVVSASVGSYARLHIFDGVEYIAYHDASWGTLNLMEGTSGSYTHTVVDQPAQTGPSHSVGQWPSIWTDGSTLSIAYHDNGNQTLKLASRESGNWSNQVVDNSEFVGADSEIFEVDGEARIVYFDGFNNDQKQAKPADDSWATNVLGGELAAVGFHNEVTYASGTWWAASYDFTNNTLFIRTLQ